MKGDEADTASDALSDKAGGGRHSNPMLDKGHGGRFVSVRRVLDQIRFAAVRLDGSWMVEPEKRQGKEKE